MWWWESFSLDSSPQRMAIWGISTPLVSLVVCYCIFVVCGCVCTPLWQISGHNLFKWGRLYNPGRLPKGFWIKSFLTRITIVDVICFWYGMWLPHLSLLWLRYPYWMLHPTFLFFGSVNSCVVRGQNRVPHMSRVRLLPICNLLINPSPCKTRSMILEVTSAALE